MPAFLSFDFPEVLFVQWIVKRKVPIRSTKFEGSLNTVHYWRSCPQATWTLMSC